jgi:hypothetical protein
LRKLIRFSCLFFSNCTRSKLLCDTAEKAYHLGNDGSLHYSERLVLQTSVDRVDRYERIAGFAGV